MHKTISRIVGILCLLLSAAAWAEETYDSSAPLDMQGEGPWYQLDLSADIQFHSKTAGFHDIRIVDANHEEQPYAFVSPQSEAHTTPAIETPVRFYMLRGDVQSGGELSGITIQKNGNDIAIAIVPENANTKSDVALGYLIDVSDSKGALQSIKLHWRDAAEGFYAYQLAASDDLETWRSLGSGQLYQLQFNDRSISKDDISLSGIKAKYLRLIWQDSKATLTLTGGEAVAAQGDVVEAPSLAWSGGFKGRLVTFDGAQQDKTQQVFEWTFPNAVDLCAVRLSLPEGHMLLPYILSGASSTQGGFHEITRGVFYRLIGADGTPEELNEKNLAAQHITTLRLSVDRRGGGLNSQEPEIEVALPPMKLVFLARGVAPYKVLLGQKVATSTALPFSTLVPQNSGLNDKRIAKAVLAAPLTTLASPPPVAEVKPGFNWRVVPLWGSLIIGVLFLLWMATRLMKAAEKNKPKV